MAGSESLYGFGIAAIYAQSAEVIDILTISVNVQVARDAGFFFETTERDGVIDTIFRHVTVGRPLAARDSEQTGVIDMNGVIARKSGCLARVRSGGFHQRANANIDAEDILAARWTAEIALRCLEDEVDLLLHGQWIVRGPVDGSVGGADHSMTVPGDGEEHAAIAGVRHHDGGV